MHEQTLIIAMTALAGGLGAVLRFVVDGAVTARLARRVRGQVYPWGVTVVNVSGSFAIGLLAGVLPSGHPLLAVLGIGLLGGYTTFSAASYDTVRLLRRGRIVAGLSNSVGQLIVAVLSAWLGVLLGALLGALSVR